MGNKWPVLRPRCIRFGRARTQITFIHSLKGNSKTTRIFIASKYTGRRDGFTANVSLSQYSHPLLNFISHGAIVPCRPGTPHYRGFTITLRHTTLDSTPLDEWSARRRDFYLTVPNTHRGQTSMPPAGFEPTILASERRRTYAIGRAATGMNFILSYLI
jgi:hypothetical protein